MEERGGSGWRACLGDFGVADRVQKCQHPLKVRRGIVRRIANGAHLDCVQSVGNSCMYVDLGYD